MGVFAGVIGGCMAGAMPLWIAIEVFDLSSPYYAGFIGAATAGAVLGMRLWKYEKF